MSEPLGATTVWPRQGEIWLVSLGAGRPGEPGKNRPSVVVSHDSLLTGSPYDLISVVPLSASRRPQRLRPAIPTDHGIERPCVAVCDAVRAVVPSRFLQRIGSLDPVVFAAVMEARHLIETYDDPDDWTGAIIREQIR
ncbi:MAG: type II toxin-antitoxin system PemK/MazF family toxin [Propionibacteriaceae bacterium]|jgi:mRNA interferase MazF|nr:type II toxin-antitoxin system PemK/MazF family toxin [Propionibacteriaceae bacterium]